MTKTIGVIAFTLLLGWGLSAQANFPRESNRINECINRKISPHYQELQAIADSGSGRLTLGIRRTMVRQARQDCNR